MCTSPLILVKYGLNPETNKPFTKIKKRVDFSLNDYYQKYGRENVFLVPCGHCAACVLQRRKEWAFRCSLEALYHKESCFLTLTYDDVHLPSSFDIVKSDLKKFIKSIRNSGYKIRYFGCGEKGESLGRYHAHIILFGFLPSDIEYIGKSDSGEAIYKSKFIEDIWSKGLCSVQLCGSNVGQYVAGYTSKKLGTKEGFQIQSTRPGIGYQFLVDNSESILYYMKVYSESGIGSIPRYFKRLFSDAYYFVGQYISTIQNMINYKKARDFGYKNIEMIYFKDDEHFLNVLSKQVRRL